MSRKRLQHGFLIIAAIVLILIFSVIGVIATYFVNTDILSSANQLRSKQAFYITEAGLEAAAHQLSIPTIANRTACANITGHANLTQFTFTNAEGPFTVTGTVQAPTPSSLSSAIIASDTTIPVANIAAYPSMGRIMIDRELIDYVTLSGNNFIHVRRGVAGTTAVAHASGAPVSQYQCLLQSQGGVPTLSPAGNVVGGEHWINETVQLPEAWAVGNAGEGMHWNKPTEKQWVNTSIAGISERLNGIYILSYADAWVVGHKAGSNYTIAHWNGSSWSTETTGLSPPASDMFSIFCTAHNSCEAVGNNRTMLFWNGSTWATQSTSGIPNVDYKSVYCNAANDCWAVGTQSGNQDVFVHWDGSAWSQDSSNPTPSEDLNSVWCNNANDCWAVGESRAFVRWNGSNWSAQSVSSLPNVNYNGVTCVNSNDCWAVGDEASGSVTVHWNGTAWTRNTSPTTNTHLQAVSCSKTDSCWAVGNSATSLYWDGSGWTSISNSLSDTLRSVAEIGAPTQPASPWQEQFP